LPQLEGDMARTRH